MDGSYKEVYIFIVPTYLLRCVLCNMCYNNLRKLHIRLTQANRKYNKTTSRLHACPRHLTTVSYITNMWEGARTRSHTPRMLYRRPTEWFRVLSTYSFCCQNFPESSCELQLCWIKPALVLCFTSTRVFLPAVHSAGR